jgi:hypothetical protein
MVRVCRSEGTAERSSRSGGRAGPGAEAAAADSTCSVHRGGTGTGGPSRAVQALCQAVGPELVWAWEADTGRLARRLRRQLEAGGVRTWLGPPPAPSQVCRARTAVKSPGIPFEAPLIMSAAALGLEVLDELELGWRVSRVRMIAVTGTNGKSTVAGLTAGVLAAAGFRVQLAGNTEFGPPLSAAGQSLDWIVSEASSFQLEGSDRLLPEIAVFTNLTPEHLAGTGRSIATGSASAGCSSGTPWRCRTRSSTSTGPSAGRWRCSGFRPTTTARERTLCSARTTAPACPTSPTSGS